jgi:hypothetical protein
MSDARAVCPSARRMAARLRPRVMPTRLVSSAAVALLKPAAVSFSGLSAGAFELEHATGIA